MSNIPWENIDVETTVEGHTFQKPVCHSIQHVVMSRVSRHNCTMKVTYRTYEHPPPSPMTCRRISLTPHTFATTFSPWTSPIRTFSPCATRGNAMQTDGIVIFLPRKGDPGHMIPRLTSLPMRHAPVRRRPTISQNSFVVVSACDVFHKAIKTSFNNTDTMTKSKRGTKKWFHILPHS